MSLFPVALTLGLMVIPVLPIVHRSDRQGGPELVSLQATATIGGKQYGFTGKGECHHTSEASIYDMPAAMWHASFSTTTGGLERANLTLWEPKGGGATQVTLMVRAGGATYEIATVKGGTVRGTAAGRVERQGVKGTLIVDGRTATGQTVQLSVTCSRFTAPEQNG